MFIAACFVLGIPSSANATKRDPTLILRMSSEEYEEYCRSEIGSFLLGVLYWSAFVCILAVGRRLNSRTNPLKCLTGFMILGYVILFMELPTIGAGAILGFHTVWAWWFGFMIEAVRLNRNANQTLHTNPDSAVAPSGSVS